MVWSSSVHHDKPYLAFFFNDIDVDNAFAFDGCVGYVEYNYCDYDYGSVQCAELGEVGFIVSILGTVQNTVCSED